ncbi:hypothetical protein KSP39_PZI005858 [Platanthera zijinensis]|uniref:Cation/H+ exchanger domain-containing protein n=1 Tax=Platanthera zijinensis TaxID=2320716 RepID=A0AAP0BS18_9ASPA
MLATKSHSIAMGVTSMEAYLTFLVFLVFVARQLTILAIKRTPEGGMLNDVCFIRVLVLVIGCGFIGELIGSRALAKPFFLGFILPGGAPLGVTMVKKLERMVERVFLPVLMALVGIRMDVASLKILLLFLIMVVGWDKGILAGLNGVGGDKHLLFTYMIQFL